MIRPRSGGVAAELPVFRRRVHVVRWSKILHRANPPFLFASVLQANLTRARLSSSRSSAIPMLDLAEVVQEGAPLQVGHLGELDAVHAA